MCLGGSTDSMVGLSNKQSNTAACGFLKITSGTCEDEGLLTIFLNKECQGAIMDLGIKADFLLMEASQAPLHGCWLETSNNGGLPIARVNKGGLKNAAGVFSRHYSETNIGICKTKGCDDVDYEYLYYHYMSRLSDQQYCNTCKESTCVHCVTSLVFRTLLHDNE